MIAVLISLFISPGKSDNWAFSVNDSVSYLVKIELKKREDIYMLERLGVSILEDMNSYVLADVCHNFIKSLRKSNFNFWILDQNSQTKEYYLVFLVADKDTFLLKTFGKILLYDTNVVLLHAFDEYGLFSGRWELKKLMKYPIKIKYPVERQFKFQKEPIIEEIVASVVQDSITSYIQRLEHFVTRCSFTDSCVSASRWIYNKFTSFGIDSVFYHDFEPEYAPSVVATIVGYMTPQKTYIICGHYDCISNSPEIFAPGADDNASGTAAVIEAARVLTRHRFESTIRFIAFCGEEQGLIGSRAYANMCRSDGDSILGVLNCDMIGYNAGSNTIQVGKRDDGWSEGLADFFIACADSYVTNLGTYKFSVPRYSDHASFWDEGYEAIISIEKDWNPSYHTTWDTLGLLDPIFFTNVVKANVATLTSLAVPVPARMIKYFTHEIDDISGGNGNRVIDPDESINLLMWVKNFGTDTAYGVTGKLSTEDSFIVITDSIKSFGNILERNSAFTRYTFRISNNCPPYNYTIKFTLTCKDINDSTWISHFSDVTGGKIVELQEITGPELVKIYPNPFIKKTTIRICELWQKVGLKFQISIYDLSGRVVCNLPIPSSSPVTLIVWDGKDDQSHDLPSGIYFCQVKVGKAFHTQKLILIR